MGLAATQLPFLLVATEVATLANLDPNIVTILVTTPQATQLDTINECKYIFIRPTITVCELHTRIIDGQCRQSISPILCLVQTENKCARF